MTDVLDKAKKLSLEDIKPYSNNPKEHPEEQIEHLKNSIQKFGFTVPMIITDSGEIVAGHGRYEAAKELGKEEVPVIIRDDLTEEQVKEFRLADNKVAESGWENDKLQVELEELEEMGTDLSDTGLDELLDNADIEQDEEGRYTDKIETPTYEPTGPKPSIEALTDKEKFEKLVEKIEQADISDRKKEFLKVTAYRHIVFDYEEIAEFYAHEDEEMQELMEELTLVIIDYEQAVEQGFVTFVEESLDEVGE